MAASRKIVGNSELSYLADLLWSRYNNDPAATLRLFTNDYEPNPGSQQDDFVEASFPGYSSILLQNKFSVPVKIEEGKYEISTPLLAFASPTGGSSIEVFGSYLTRNGDVLGASRFLTSRKLIPGDGGLAMRVKLPVMSESLFLFE